MELDEFKPLIELAFSEGGNAFYWILFGGIVSVVLGLLALVIWGVAASKRQWPAANNTGIWCRRIFIVYCIFAISGGAFFTGATWGLLTALKDAVDSQQIIEKVSEEALSPIVASLYLVTMSEKNGNNRVDFEEEARLFLAEGKTINVLDFEKRFSQLIEAFHSGIVEVFLSAEGSEGDGMIEGLKDILLAKMYIWIAESKVEEIETYVQEVLDGVRNIESVDLSSVSCEAISSEICRVHVRPKIDQEFHRYKKFFVILSLLQIVVTVGLPALIIHIVFKLILKPKTEEDLEIQ